MGYATDLANGLKIISKENKGDLNPDPWYAWYHFSHPHLIERLMGIEVEEKKYLASKKKAQ